MIPAAKGQKPFNPSIIKTTIKQRELSLGTISFIPLFSSCLFIDRRRIVSPVLQPYEKEFVA